MLDLLSKNLLNSMVTLCVVTVGVLHNLVEWLIIGKHVRNEDGSLVIDYIENGRIIHRKDLSIIEKMIKKLVK